MTPSSQGVERFFQLSLLGVVTSGFLAVAGSGYLDAPTILLTACGLLLRAALVAGLARFTIPDRMVTAVTIAYIGFYPLDYQFLSKTFLDATVHLVFFLAVVKILTARVNRDYLYTAAIALLELLAGALLSIQLNFFLFLGLFLFFSIATLTSAEIRRSLAHSGGNSQLLARGGQRMSPRLSALAILISLGVLSLTSGLFFLLPRTANAALRHLAAKGYYLPGFSNQVTLGQIGEIKTRSNAVMHVRVYKKDGRLNAKWRGAGLSDFDGRRWFNPPGSDRRLRVGGDGRLILADDRQLRRRGYRVAYRVDLKAIDSDALFFAGVPEVLNINAASLIRTPSDSYHLGAGGGQGLRYEVYSFIDGARSGELEISAEFGPMALPEGERSRYLQLPTLDSRIAPLAWEMTAGAASTADRARAIENRLHRDYAYTLELPSRAVADPLANFLFERKKGHCEYYASAMAVLLRTIGVPSRLVTGFQSGVFNPISEMYLIRASDAHSWVEAWLPERGWTTFDPTPPDPNPLSLSLWSKLTLYADAADTFWQEWVVSYDLGRQVALADKMERSSRTLKGDWLGWFGRLTSQWNDNMRGWARRYLAAFAIAGIVCVAMVFLGPSIWRGLRVRHRARQAGLGQGSVADATLLYRRFLDLLRKKGYSKPPWYTPGEFTRSLAAPGTEDFVALAERFTAAYLELRFGGKLEAAPRLSLLLKELERLG